MQLLLIFTAIVFGLLACAACYSIYKTRDIEARYPPSGSFAKVADVTLHYVDSHGELPSSHQIPLVFIHGASSSCQDAMLAFRGKLPNDRRLIFVDRPGHGYSSRPASHYSDPKLQADLIKQLLDHLQIKKAIMVGHSWGGAVVAAFALDYAQSASGLVFLAPATHPWPGGLSLYYRLAGHSLSGPLFCAVFAIPLGLKKLPSAIRSVFSPDNVPKNYAHDVAAELVLRPRNFAANARDVYNLKTNLLNQSPNYGRISCPALILTGTRDDIVWPHLHSHGLKRDLQNAELIEYENCGHMPHHSRNEEVIAAMIAFMDKLKSGL